jgi:isoleucyl-tRNA synthetase
MTDGMRQLPAQVDLPALERAVLERWERDDVFARSLERTAGGEPWVFYEGPPTANGKPGTHHVEARVFKDLFPRFKTMQGRSVPRRAGWDCHGLPVELAVEKELGFTGKGDIEAYGVAAFNQRCRESVLRHVDEFERMTRGMGYWVDMDPRPTAPWTRRTSRACGGRSSRSPTRACWSRTTGSRRGAPRCGTALSDHELGSRALPQRRRPRVYVRMPVTDGPLAELGARCWCGRRRRGRWCPTPPSPSTPTSPTPRARRRARCSWSPSRCSQGARRATSRCSSASPAARWRHALPPAPSTGRRSRTRTTSSPPTT